MKRSIKYAADRSPSRMELKVIAIGNSKGVRLPKAVLDRYAIKDAVVLEARDDGLLLRGKKDRRLSWDETFKDMAHEREEWRDFEVAVGDGLGREPW